MKPKAALMVAAAMTAFILVITGAVINNLMQPTPAQRSIALDQPMTIEPAENAVNQPSQNVEQPVDMQPPVIEQPALIQQPAQGVEAISQEQAVAFAQQYLGGGDVAKVEREIEHGQDVYNVKFDNGSEVYVDSFTGEVVYVKSEAPATNRNDDHGDDDDDDHDD
ncbi:MAG: PepSY domain-containing protein [Herpetosiphon sp.]|nr:PepSY domain-containing protein [Herpetosiphon sp.]